MSSGANQNGGGGRGAGAAEPRLYGASGQRKFLGG